MVLVVGKDVEDQAAEAKEEGGDADENEELSRARIVPVAGSTLAGRLVRSLAQWKIKLCGLVEAVKFETNSFNSNFCDYSTVYAIRDTRVKTERFANNVEAIDLIQE